MVGGDGGGGDVVVLAEMVKYEVVMGGGVDCGSASEGSIEEVVVGGMVT